MLRHPYNRRFNTISLILILLLSACSGSQPPRSSFSDAITEEGIDHYISVLAHDSLMGRKPFTEGETKTLQYLQTVYSDLGLEPANNGAYLQEVPMVEIKSNPQAVTYFKNKNDAIGFKILEDMVLGSQRVQADITTNQTELVFVGFGIVAPEYNWNDYAGLDVKGKTVVILINDPGFYNEQLFKGKNMTYYGRWTYKFEEAARQGAEGALIIHDTDAASYGWHVVRGGWSGPQLTLQSPDDGASRCAFEGWLSAASATKLFNLADISLHDLTEQAKTPEFESVALPISTSIHIEQEYTKSVSNNVVGLLKGAKRPDEVIVYSAHWDHFGIGESINGDSIYNGAVDNATGVAGLLEIAKAFSQTPTKPERSVMFIALTGEEEGLLGSAYYAKHPIYPLSKTVANINMDAMAPIGRTKDITIMGLGQSELDDYADAAAKAQGRKIVPPADPSNGWFYRSDHFNFAKVGVPALYPATGDLVIGQDDDYGKKRKAAYNKFQYHQPTDEYDPASWKLDGIIEDLKLLFNVGYRLSSEKTFPKWKEGSEFKATGEQR